MFVCACVLSCVCLRSHHPRDIFSLPQRHLRTVGGRLLSLRPLLAKGNGIAAGVDADRRVEGDAVLCAPVERGGLKVANGVRPGGAVLRLEPGGGAAGRKRARCGFQRRRVLDTQRYRPLRSGAVLETAVGGRASAEGDRVRQQPGAAPEADVQRSMLAWGGRACVCVCVAGDRKRENAHKPFSLSLLPAF